jgi:prepilin-type N-terminal cleavage/methylation domain-containing protein
MARIMRSKKSGFSLIELLVVIGIILILMSILGPQLVKGREFANRASCLANIRSIGQTMQIFANENNDIFPIDGNYVNQAFTPPEHLLLKAFGLIYHAKVFNDLKVFLCPNNKKNSIPLAPVDDNKRGNPLIMPAKSRISYAIVLASTDGAALVRPTLTDPGKNVLLIENPTSGNTGDVVDEFDRTDNHGQDGGNVYLIGGQAKWWQVPVTGATAGDGEPPVKGGDVTQALPLNYCLEDPKETYVIQSSNMLQEPNKS